MSKTILYRTNDQKSKDFKDSYFQYLDDKNKGKQIEYLINIKRNRPVRSVSHNKYYRMILKCIAPYAGYTEDQLHEFFKLEYNSIEVMGKTIGETTSDMDSTEFSIFIKKVKSYGRDILGAYIPEREDKSYSAWAEITQTNYDNWMLSKPDEL